MSDKKYGRNKKFCEHYKSVGQREHNKALKQERAEKLVAKFAKRREEGKTYEYKPIQFDKDSKDKRERNNYWNERRDRAEKNVDRRDAFSRMKSLLRKTQNQIDEEENARKKLEDSKHKKVRKNAGDGTKKEGNAE